MNKRNVKHEQRTPSAGRELHDIECDFTIQLSTAKALFDLIASAAQSTVEPQPGTFYNAAEAGLAAVQRAEELFAELHGIAGKGSAVTQAA